MFFLGASSFVGAQEVSGTVLDDTSQPLPGVSIVIKGTSTGTTSDFEGNFSIAASDGDVLVFSYVGFDTQEVTVSGSAVNVTMQAGVALDSVVITGTRSRPRTKLSSPVPIDNFGIVEIQRQGNGDLTETIRNLVPSYTATPLTGDGSAFVRPTSLRGLPPDEVLVLVNSKRRHRSSLIAHFGAAMNVGAHAVDIGQIPSIALKNVEVLRDGAAAQYGSDAIAGVMNFILRDNTEGLEIQSQVGKWYGKNFGKNETDYKVAINFGLPITEKGFINISGEYTFNQELSRGVQHASAIGVPGAQEPAMNWGRPESSGFRSVWNAGFDLSENSKLYSYGNFADTYGNYSFFYRSPGRSGVLTPVPNDPHDPSKGNFSWGDEYPAGFTPRLEGFMSDFSSITGIKGTFGDDINYDISLSFGHNIIHYVLNNTLNPSWGPLSQTVFQPGDLKQAERNFNIDLSKELSDNFVLSGGFQTRNERYTMFVGDYQSWAQGPWGGVSNLINPDTGENYAEPSIGANGLAGTSRENAGTFEGKSWGAYLDAEWDINEDFLLQVAYRHEDYKEFGNTDNFKIASRYKMLEDKLTLRGSFSTGFRAPTPGQANVVTITTSFDGVSGEQVQEGTVSPTDPLAVSLGGKALVPEESENFTFGLASKITNTLTFSLDWYQIEVDKRIIKSRSLPVVDPNFSELAFYTNALNTRTFGLDAVLTWRDDNTNLSIAYNYNKTKVLGQTQVNGQNPVSDGTIFNIENNLPKSRASVTVNRKFGKLNAMLRSNSYGKTIDERGDREEVGAVTILDLELSYPVSDQLILILGANNILDTYPNEIATRLSQGMPYPRRTPIGYLGGVGFVRAVYKIN